MRVKNAKVESSLMLVNVYHSFRYSSEEIHFNLMAVVSDRKQTFLREIEALNHQKRQLLEQVTALCTNFYIAITEVGSVNLFHNAWSLAKYHLTTFSKITNRITVLYFVTFWKGVCSLFLEREKTPIPSLSMPPSF